MISVIIPIYNPDSTLEELLYSLRNQTIKKIEIILIDSSVREERQKEIATFFNVEKYLRIRQEDFDHGGTRNKGLLVAEGDILVYMTQDAVPFDSTSIEKLVSPIVSDSTVGAAYGRQLPRKGANPIEAHARLFNYPAMSALKKLSDKSTLGIKTAFISNSFAAYRKEALAGIGGFPSNVIIGEDMYAAAKMLLKGWKIAYCADAMVYHSHNYSIWQEFKRYFDIGVFHGRENWIIETFGKAEGEGLRFVLSEFRYLLREKPALIPSAIIRNLMKLIGYKLGYKEEMLPLWIKRRLSMNEKFWLKKNL